MDNLTHTLIGVLAGEAFARSTRPVPGGLPEATRRNLFVTIGAVGSNLPDIDILWTLQGLGADPLNYLVHHRGHTHTLLGCVGLLLLLQGAVLLWMKWRGVVSCGRDRALLACVGALGLGLHLGMDSLNSYGIHPFWPFDNHWYYGDAVFIVEPLYWLAAVPGLLLFRTRWAKALAMLAVLAALLLTTWLHLAEPVYYLAALAVTALLVVVGRRASARTAAWSGVAFAGLVTASFLLASHFAHTRVASMAAAVFPDAVTRDIVLTPSPTDPRCWDLLLLQTEGREYVARQGRLALPAATLRQCPTVQLGSQGTAPLQSVRMAPGAEPADAKVAWAGEFAMPVQQLADLVAGDCRARKAMRFLRAPFVVASKEGWMLGDLRFDREAGAGFAEIGGLHPADTAATCPRQAPWLPPRADLLGSPPQG
jgi:inner membrane protein